MEPKGARVLPHNEVAEKSVLGSILIDSEALIKIADKLSPDDFYDERHGKIYEAIVKLYEKNSPIDVLTLADQLNKDGWLDRVGGSDYLSELTNFVPTAIHVESYAAIVGDRAVRRRLIKSSHETAELAYADNDETIRSLIEEAESRLFNISEKHVQQNIASIEGILTETFERLDDLHKNKGKLRGVPTGLADLDKMTAGLHPSDLFILAARPSMGKTALMLNVALNVATKAKRGGVLLFSLEMGKEQLVDRMLAAEAGVDAWKLRTGEGLVDSDFERLSEAMGILAEAPIYIDDTPGITVSDMRTKARRLAHQNPLALIIVDYLQLMSGGSRFASSANRVQEISEISRGLKIMARELNVPLIALSQLSRSVEARPDKRPQLSDLRESGSIEQDADLVAFIYREEYYNPETEKANITEILVKKHRNGPVGNIELYFDKEKQQYKTLAKADQNPFSS